MAGAERVSVDPASAGEANAGERRDDALPLALLAICIAGLVSVEAALIAAGHVLAGQIVDGVLLLALVLRVPARSARSRQAVAAMRALALVPLARVVTAGLPLGHFSQALDEVVVAVPIGFAAIRIAPIARVDLRALIVARRDRSQAPAVGAGVALGLVVYLLGAPPLLPAGASTPRVLVAVVAVIGTAFVEELVFRGLVQITLQRLLGRVGVVAAAVLFACTYLDAGSAGLVLALALAGLVFAYSVARTGSLAGAIAGHCALSIGAVVVWPAVFGRSHSMWLDSGFTTTGLAVLLLAAALAAIRVPRVES